MSKSQSKKIKLLAASLAVGSLYFMPTPQASAAEAFIVNSSGASFYTAADLIPAAEQHEAMGIAAANKVQRNSIEIEHNSDAPGWHSVTAAEGSTAGKAYNDSRAADTVAYAAADETYTPEQYEEAGIVPGDSADETSIAIGKGSNAPGEHSVAVGEGATAGVTGDNNDSRATAVGVSSKATGWRSTAIGENAQATGQFSTAVGNDSFATGKGSTALGKFSVASGESSTALGNNSRATAEGAAAVGAGSIASEKDTVSVGYKKGDMLTEKTQATEDYQRRIVNVKEARLTADSTDAVTGRQLYATNQRVASLESRMGDVEERIDKVGAMSAAIANLRTMGYDPEAPTEIAIGVGQYKSETGVALGVFHYPNQDFMLSASISTSGDEVMGGIGATWKLGRKSAAERERISEEKAAEKAAEIKAAAEKAAKDAEVNAQREKHAQLLAQREAAHQDIHQSAEEA